MKHMKHLGNVVRKILAPSTSTLPQSPCQYVGSFYQNFGQVKAASCKGSTTNCQEQFPRVLPYLVLMHMGVFFRLDKSGKFTQDSKAWYLSPQLGISLNIF